MAGSALPAPAFGDSTPDDWDSITIGAWFFERTKVTITGDITAKLDVAPAPGTDGARETYQGYVPAKIEVSVVLYTNDMIAQWATMMASLRPLPGKRTLSSATISHPLIRMGRIGPMFYTPVISIPRPIGPQLYEGRIQCVEKFDKPKPIGKQSGSLGSLDTRWGNGWDSDGKAKPTDPQNDPNGNGP